MIVVEKILNNYANALKEVEHPVWWLCIIIILLALL